MNLALDLDGTLVSCEPRQSSVLQAALVRSGARVDLNRIWEFKREGASTEQALGKLGLESALVRRVVTDWRRMIEEPLWLGLDSILPGVMETLHAMRKTGARLWLLTARSRSEWVSQQLTHLRLRPWLDHVTVVSPQEAERAKGIALRKASACAFFGDTESDWHASTAAGVPFYAVSSGQRSAEFLTAAGVKPVHRGLAAAWQALIEVSGASDLKMRL